MHAHRFQRLQGIEVGLALGGGRGRCIEIQQVGPTAAPPARNSSGCAWTARVQTALPASTPRVAPCRHGHRRSVVARVRAGAPARDAAAPPGSSKWRRRPSASVWRSVMARYCPPKPAPRSPDRDRVPGRGQPALDDHRGSDRVQQLGIASLAASFRGAPRRTARRLLRAVALVDHHHRQAETRRQLAGEACAKRRIGWSPPSRVIGRRPPGHPGAIRGPGARPAASRGRRHVRRPPPPAARRHEGAAHRHPDAALAGIETEHGAIRADRGARGCGSLMRARCGWRR